MSKVTWLVMGPEPHFAHCTRCGGTVPKPTLPAPIDLVVGWTNAATKMHQHCKPNPNAKMPDTRTQVDGAAPLHQRAMAWISGPDTGISSKAIWRVMQGVVPEQRAFGCYPSDPDDFGRCYRLLELIPEWRPRIAEMAGVSDTWKALSVAWDELETLWRTEGNGTGDPPAGTRMNKLYERMKELTR